MRVHVVGGGPAGLYSGILLKGRDPSHEITVFERNKPEETFGFGVVFSDATLDGLARADAPSFAAIERAFFHWDDIEIHHRGSVVRSTGHGFSGLSRKTLLRILQDRARELGVDVRFEHEVRDLSALGPADLVILADGVNSAFRTGLAEHFRPRVEARPNKFTWLGTTFPFEAFTFWFKELPEGLVRVHAYRFEPGLSTFIVECTEDAWRRAGLEGATDEQTVAFFERAFAAELRGHRLVANRSIWRNFPAITCERWHHENRVLLGDAVHTAHFSIGSGTKLAMEDAIALVDALGAHPTVPAALAAYEAERRPVVEATQRAAQVSLEWFEDTERYVDDDPLDFAMSLLTRSLRITHENLRVRDPALVARVDRHFAARAAERVGDPAPGDGPAPPPMFAPFKLRGMRLENRVVVSPMCQYSAEDGTIDDWHLVHLGSRAIGGAGLVIAEMTDVSADGRITPGCAGIYDERHAEGWRRVTRFVHRHSQAKIALQLGHAGRKGATKRLWEGMDEPLAEGGWPLLAASALPYHPRSPVPKAMDRADMDRVLGDYVRAVELARLAEFDMLELHLAHGYLLATFLSPLTNTRADEYGGSLENRLRFPLEVWDTIRAAWPAERPMGARISATDWAPGGLSGEDAVGIAKALAARGCDLVDVSTGQTVAEGRPRFGRLFQTPFADRIRHEARVATMAVGGISSHADVNSILAAGRADLCALGRVHLWDPYWTRHAAYEQAHPMEWPPQYVTVSARAKYSVRLR